MPYIKLIHTSDVHIDSPFEKFADGPRQQRRRDLFETFDYVCDQAVSESVQGLLITGDLFHSNLADRHSVSMVISSFMKLLSNDIKIIILPGNHDPGIKELLEKNGGLLPNMFVFSGEGWQEYTEIDGVTIWGHPYVETKRQTSVLPELKVMGAAGLKVGMLHGTVSGLPHIDGDYFPITPEEVAGSGLDYLALGHFHNLRDCSSGKTKCFYPGSPDRLTFNNLADRKAILITMEKEVLNVNSLNVPARPYIVIDFDLNQESLADLYVKLNQWGDKGACVRLNAIGVVHEENMFTVSQIEQHFAAKFFSFELNDQTKIMPDVSQSDKTVKGIFFNKLRTRLEDKNLTDEGRKILNEAVRVGLTVLEGGKL